MRSVLSILSLVFITAVGRAQLSVDFDEAGHLGLNFETAAQNNLWTQSESGGLGGSGALAVPDVADNQFWALSPGYAGNTDHTLSAYIHTAEVLNASYFTFGIMAGSSQTGTVYPSGSDYLGVSVNPHNSEFELKGEGAFNVAGGTFDTAMQADSWYYLELTLDWQFNLFYGMNFKAYAADANGNLGASLITDTTYFAGLESDLAEDAEVFAFLGGNNSGNGIDYVDIFRTTAVTGSPLTSAVPEPSTYAVICGIAALGVVVGRRRRVNV